MPLLKRKAKDKPQKPPKPTKETRLELDLRNGRVILTRTPVAVPVPAASVPPPPPPNPTPTLTSPPLPDRGLPPPPYLPQNEEPNPTQPDLALVPVEEANDWLSLGYRMLPAVQAVGTGLVAVAGVIGVWMEMEKERRKGATGGK
ncbi:uncharacterized protein BDZ99DRAFT_470164 [Mytilinidion resinicola]|uniref:Uncharacterized protein n=1 Tax=Mytilinidion resinicola TaxID=574789 RepID=A0A6A6Z7M8_9PEZI|nr:uncharacterized protein BDZ99DRAFT_470164 [Mytilinidion resinicola]KAF2817112.1 hypothetical protein BDZ99DRAFT_470164 [Mytilinidion resinicola]